MSYDWNQPEAALLHLHQGVQFQDETLRDGLQCPSVHDPPVEAKLEILHLMEALGIHGADVGLPGAGPRALADTTRLVAEIADQRLALKPSCAGRTHRADIDPIAQVADRTGVVLEADLFLGSSPIRLYAEGWDLDRLLRMTDEAVSYAVQRGLEVMFVTEDTVRSHPQVLRRLYTTAIECGARRICLCDTVGHATPEGVEALVSLAREIVAASGEDVQIDWHGHRDRGLDVINTLTALQAGVHRIHGTALGVGERVGNTPMDQLLLNLKLLGVIDNDLRRLPDYVQTVSRAYRVPLPPNWPALGADVYRARSEVACEASLQALLRGDAELAERLWSAVPASLVGRELCPDVGPGSGESTVRWWLHQRGLEAGPEEVGRVLTRARQAGRTLEVEEILEEVRGGSPTHRVLRRPLRVPSRREDHGG